MSSSDIEGMKQTKLREEAKKFQLKKCKKKKWNMIIKVNKSKLKHRYTQNINCKYF